jgi:TPR repeat protein
MHMVLYMYINIYSILECNRITTKHIYSLDKDIWSLYENYLGKYKLIELLRTKELGDMYLEGTKLQKNVNRALFWYQKALDKGHAESAYCIRKIYEK